MTPTTRILYAEDNPQDADQTRSHLQLLAPEFEIEIADTGQGCLDQLRETAFDLLLLDQHLPDMDGLDVLKTLVHAGLQLPVVMVTGEGDEDLVVKALRLGAANYVSKQGNYLETLPDLLRSAMEEHREEQRRGLPAAASPRRILYVEHLPMDIELALRHFAEAAPHFAVDVVYSCAEALARLEQPHEYDLVLIDLRMPDLSGLDFAREAKRRHLQLPPFVMISAQGDEATAIAILKLGAAAYIPKREGYLDQLVYTIDQAIDTDRLSRVNEQLQTELNERKQAEEALARSAAQLRQQLHDTVKAMGAIIGLRDPYTAAHERRVTGLAATIAAELGLDDEAREGLAFAGEVHDIGKIGVPAEILSKPAALTEMEFALIKQHSEAGRELLGAIHFRQPVAEIVAQHHERLDGSGYPAGLKDDEIMLEARILAVADVVEAMASHRPYRPTLGLDAALGEVRSGAGTRYDADAVAACEQVFERGFVFPEP